jgi:glycerol transport system ATP-binding protein
MLELRGICRGVGAECHIEDASLCLEPGVMNVLLGPTLSGKTSLLRLMAGLDRPDRGSVLCGGRDVTALPVQRRNVAMVYQQFINYPGWTVRENIASPLRVMRMDTLSVDREVARVAELLQLGPYLERKPLELSGGQQQRVALARALVKKAGLVLLDEPLANLDYKLREDLRAELPRLFADSAAVVVYATTEPAEALLLGGNTATLHEGRITQFGPTQRVWREPLELRSAQAFSDPPLNVLAVRARDGRTLGGVDAEADSTLPRLPDGDWTLGFRPHHLRLGGGAAGTIRFRVQVIATDITGSESFVHVAYGAARWVLLVHGVHPVAAGTLLDAYVEPADILVFDAQGRALAPAQAA